LFVHCKPSTNYLFDYKDQIAINAEVVGESIVRIKPKDSNADSITGLGIIVSSDGVILADRSSIDSITDPVARLYDGTELSIHIIQSQIDGDIVFAIMDIPKEKKDSIHLSSMKFASSVKLGQSVFSLHGKNINSLEQGIIKTVNESNNSYNALTLVSPIFTSIDSSNIDIGSPLFTISGEIIGIETKTFKENKEKEIDKLG
jgi:S1-C subfamily serine protease